MKSVNLPWRIGRRGAATFELILVLPVLLLVTIGLIEFGVMFGNLQQVALASRVGAERASELASLPAAEDGDSVPEEVLEAVRQQLDSACINYCQIRLEHNAGGEQVALLSEGPEQLLALAPRPVSGLALLAVSVASCGCEEIDFLPEHEIPSGRYVRLTVTVPLSEVLPSGVTLFGCNLASPEHAFHSTTILRYERGEP